MLSQILELKATLLQHCVATGIRLSKLQCSFVNWFPDNSKNQKKIGSQEEGGRKKELSPSWQLYVHWANRTAMHFGYEFAFPANVTICEFMECLILCIFHRMFLITENLILLQKRFQQWSCPQNHWSYHITHHPEEAGLTEQ